MPHSVLHQNIVKTITLFELEAMKTNQQILHDLIENTCLRGKRPFIVLETNVKHRYFMLHKADLKLSVGGRFG